MGLFLLYSVTIWVDKWSSSLSKESKLGTFAIHWKMCAQAFIDDFCVYSTRVEHCEQLEMVLKHYDDCGGQLNPKKCFFAQPRVKLLGHMVSENGIEADPDKVKAIMLLPSPQSTKQLATFIQKVKYMARFIPFSS